MKVTVKKKVDYEYLIRGRKFAGYQEEAGFILDLIERGRISPVRSSGTNGKRPALFNRYWLFSDEEDHTEVLEEVRFRLCPRIQTDYYRKHPEVYKREREYVLALNSWLERDRKDRKKISVNERSFEIWGKEKFLSGQKADGITAADVLKHCGISADELDVYATAEPFACFTLSRETPQNILILENLDPFYGLRKYLIETCGEIFGIRVSSLIYGGGKRVVSSLGDFEISAEAYMLKSGNVFLYAGDMDYEGIRIYESLAQKVGDRIEILPFVPYYEKMLEKAEKTELPLPMMKEGQTFVEGSGFFRFFSEKEKERMKKILKEGMYIPQEILNIKDYMENAV